VLDTTSLWIAALLSVERIAYAAIWRAPDVFRQWCCERAGGRRGFAGRTSDPIDALAALFATFKALQIGLFLVWCAAHNGGSLAPYSTNAGVWLAGVLLIAFGQILNISVFRALGKTGVFYGNRFGYAVPWKRTFPFTWFEHPQYVGAVLSIWGFFILMRFPAEDWALIPIIETVYYALGASAERDNVPTDRLA
jgi:methylene-fatty-acyl-phospholipid synthase